MANNNGLWKYLSSILAAILLTLFTVWVGANDIVTQQDMEIRDLALATVIATNAIVIKENTKALHKLDLTVIRIATIIELRGE